MTHRAPGRNAILSALAVAVLLSGGIFTIPAGNARAAEATCPAAPAALSKFKPQAEKTGPIDIPFTTADGKTVTVAALAKGRGAVVNLWATWCAPCIKEMPQLDALKAELAKDGIPVIALSQDRGGLDQVKPFYAKQGYKNLDIHLDPKGAFSRAVKARGLPTTVLFDAQGRELGRVLGVAEWDAPEVAAFIRACLPKTK